MASQATFLIVQFLEWIERRPRSYDEVRAAWSSTCPLNCAWEDAVSDDLVAFRRDGCLALTERGQSRLRQAKAASAPSPP